MPGGDNAPQGFAVRVVAAWLHPVAARPAPRMSSAGDNLWEALGLRAALLAGAAVAVGLCLNVGTWREDLNLDTLGLDPTAAFFGFSLENL